MKKPYIYLSALVTLIVIGLGSTAFIGNFRGKEAVGLGPVSSPQVKGASIELDASPTATLTVTSSPLASATSSSVSIKTSPSAQSNVSIVRTSLSTSPAPMESESVQTADSPAQSNSPSDTQSANSASPSAPSATASPVNTSFDGRPKYDSHGNPLIVDVKINPSVIHVPLNKGFKEITLRITWGDGTVTSQQFSDHFQYVINSNKVSRINSGYVFASNAYSGDQISFSLSWTTPYNGTDSYPPFLLSGTIFADPDDGSTHCEMGQGVNWCTTNN